MWYLASTSPACPNATCVVVTVVMEELGMKVMVMGVVVRVVIGVVMGVMVIVMGVVVVLVVATSER